MKKYLLLLLLTNTYSLWALGQCPGGTVPSGTELVTNGDFSAGNVGFSSSYTYQLPPNNTESTYWVGMSSAAWNGGMTSNGDHTTGTGNFMMVNGSPSAGTSVWCETITITPNTEYLFAAWISSMDLTNPAILQFSINGVLLGSPFNAPNATDTWVSFNASWNSGTNTSATICIVDKNTMVGGNDFGLDDISFKACGCNFTLDMGDDTSICKGQSILLNPSPPVTTYLWSPASGLSCTTCQSPTASPVATTTYTLHASLQSCIDSGNIVITVFPPVIANAGNDTTLCNNTSGVLKAGGGVSYQWSPSSGLSCTTCQSPVVSPVLTTTYTVTVTNTNGCFASDSVVISIDNINSFAGPDTMICFGNSVQLYSGGANDFLWSPSDGLSNITASNPVATPVANTTYTVTISDALGCSSSQAVMVSVYPDFSVSVSNDTVVCSGNPVTLTASGGTTYSWTPANFLSCTNCYQVTATPASSITYTVSVADNNGCSKEEEVSVNVLPECFFIIFPTAFSPNNDGLNDFFHPIVKGVTNLNWEVFNRWGEKVFEANSINDEWDGKYNQEAQPIGVYVWSLSATLNNGSVVNKQGNVTLIR